MLVTIEQLKSATGYERLADIERCLAAAGVRWIPGKPGHIFTTEAALNAALGVQSQAPEVKEQVTIL